MRIYYLSNSNIPSRQANSVHVMKMCQGLVINNHDVTLFASEGDSSSNNDYKDYDVESCFSIIKIRSLSIRGIRKAKYLYSLRKKLEKMPKPDIFYSRDIYSLLIANSFNIPFYYESHSLPNGYIEKIIEHKILSTRNLKNIILISNELKKLYINLFPFLSRKRIIVAHDGADIIGKKEDNKPNILWKKRKHALQIGYVGHLYKGRGIEIILSLASKIHDVDFHIVGGTDIDIKKWRKRTHAQNLWIHGYYPPKDINWILNQFDIVLAPYQKKTYVPGGMNTAKWMSPMKIFEYMAAGKSIICSDLPVLREILVDKETALMVESDNIELWIKAIRGLQNNSILRKNLGYMAQKEHQNKYTWKIRAERVLKEQNE